MARWLKLLTIFAIFLLPVKIAEARHAASPDVVVAALDLGHCSPGDTTGKQHPRAHAHCSMVAAQAEPGKGPAAMIPFRPLAMPRAFATVGPRGLGPQAPTPPPRT